MRFRTLPLCLALAAVHVPLGAQAPAAGEEPLIVATAPDGTVTSVDPTFINPTEPGHYFVRVVYRFPPEQAQRTGTDRRVETQEIDCGYWRTRFRGVTELSGDSVVRGPAVPLPGDPWTYVPPADLPGFRAVCGAVQQAMGRAEQRSQPVTRSDALTGPSLLNGSQVGRALVIEYPPALRSAGVSGSVELMMKVGENGTVAPGSFAVMTATHPEFAAAAARVVARMRFAPGTLNGRPVKTWVTLPLTFSLGG